MNICPGRSGFPIHRPMFLASVTSPDEARVCVGAGADLIDAKNPLTGALGALPLTTVSEIVEAVREAPGQTRLVSATVGDLPMEPTIVREAVETMADTGVDFVKIGLGGGKAAFDVVDALSAFDVGTARLVGVLFADQNPDFSLVEAMAKAGFAGVMLDTAAKRSGRLVDVQSPENLSEFVRLAGQSGLFCGLAGSLKRDDIGLLGRFGADILGFRGALCLDSDRTFAIDEGRVACVRAALDALSDLAVPQAG